MIIVMKVQFSSDRTYFCTSAGYIQPEQDVDSQTAMTADRAASQRTVIVDAGHGGEDPGK